MGNKATGPFRDAYNPSLQGWQLHRRSEDFNVWQNPSTGEQLQQYRFVINDAKQFQHEKEIFEFRYDSSTLVSSRYFREDTQRQLCSTYYKGTLFLERIPIRLSNINDLPYPDVLHLYHQSFRGFAELYDKMGYFNIEENMICLNQQGKVKVWLNDQLDKSYPVERVMGGTGTEKEMVRRIVQLIDQNTDGLTLPENIGGLLQQADPPTFRDADLMVQNFAARYRTTIPSQIDSVLRREDIVRAVDSVYLHPAGPGVAQLSSEETLANQLNKVSIGSVAPSQAMVGTANFGQGTITHQHATSIAPAMVQTLAPQQLIQTFAPTKLQVPPTPISSISGLSPTTHNVPLIHQSPQAQHQQVHIHTAKEQPRTVPGRSTSIVVRPTSGMGVPLLNSLHQQQHKQPTFGGLPPNATIHRQPLFVPQPPQQVQQVQQVQQIQQIQQVQQQFQQSQQSHIKPSTTQRLGEEQKMRSSNIFRGSFSNRINSKSLASRPGQTSTSLHITPQQQQPQSASSTNRSYSSMISLGLRNNLVGAAKKLEEAAEQQRVATNETPNKVETVSHPRERRPLATTKSQIITPMQHVIGTSATVRPTRVEASEPSSHFMQLVNRLHTRQHSVSQSGDVTKLHATVNVVQPHHQQLLHQHQQQQPLFTVAERNNEYSTSNVSQPGHIAFGTIREEKPRILSTHTTHTTHAALETPAPQVFQSSMLHPSLQVTYENSQITIPGPEAAPPADTNVSFGRGGSNINIQTQYAEQYVSEPERYNYVPAPISTEGILTSQDILDTINQIRSKPDDHLVNHLPVTYSVLKESEEYLAKYGLNRNAEPNYYVETATSGIRASLGSHYNEEQLGRNLYYNRQQHQEEIRELDAFQPIYEQKNTYQEYYLGSENGGLPATNFIEVQERRVVEHIEKLDTAQLKHSMFEETTTINRNTEMRTFQSLAEPHREVRRHPMEHASTITTIVVDDYTPTMDSELRRDLQKMRKSQL